jgi:hypothetical protein
VNPFIIGALLTGYVATLTLVVGILPSTRMRAIVYSVPVPMSTLAILDPGLVDPNILIGLIVNASFFWLVASGDRFGWHRTSSTLIATAVYVGVSWLFKELPGISISTALAFSLVTWILILPRVRRIPAKRSSPVEGFAIKRMIVTFFTATSAVSISSILGPYVVTFPFTGITLALNYPGSVVPFARSFWVNGLPPLLAFGTGMVSGKEMGLPIWGAVLVGFTCWGAITGVFAVFQRSST